VDALVAHALSTPLRIAIVASGLLVLERTLDLSPRWDRALDVTLTAAIVLALVLFVDRATRGLLDRLAGESMVLQGARGLIQGSIRGLTIAIGLLIFLDGIGISITPLLASLGVGSLAVALALQDTLANLFAGIYMVIDKPIEAGQFIRLENGEQGYVTRVGWRSTWIRKPSDSIIVVPNVKLAGSIITNYDLPRKELAVSVDLCVHYASDLGKVERVTLDVARETMREAEGGVPGRSRRCASTPSPNRACASPSACAPATMPRATPSATSSSSDSTSATGARDRHPLPDAHPRPAGRPLARPGGGRMTRPKPAGGRSSSGRSRAAAPPGQILYLSRADVEAAAVR